MVKNPPANAGEARDSGWIPGSEEGVVTTEMVCHHIKDSCFIASQSTC